MKHSNSHQKSPVFAASSLPSAFSVQPRMRRPSANNNNNNNYNYNNVKVPPPCCSDQTTGRMLIADCVNPLEAQDLP